MKAPLFRTCAAPQHTTGNEPFVMSQRALIFYSLVPQPVTDLFVPNGNIAQSTFCPRTKNVEVLFGDNLQMNVCGVERFFFLTDFLGILASGITKELDNLEHFTITV